MPKEPQPDVDNESKIEPQKLTDETVADPATETKVDDLMAVDDTTSEVPADTTGESPAVPAPVVSPQSKSHKKVIILLVVLVALIGGGAAWYFLMGPGKSTKTNAVATPPKTKPVKEQATPKLDPILAKMIAPTTGETWLATPKKVDDLGYVNSNGDEVDYYQVGMHGQNTIYMSVIQDMGNPRMLYEKAPDGTVRAVTQPNANGNYTSDDVAGDNQMLAKGVIPDTTIHYDSLTWPDSFSIGNGETVTPQYTDYFGTTATAPANDLTVTTVQKYGASKLVRIERKYTDTGLTAINYELDTPIGTGVTLTYAPISKDLSTYTWDNGTTVAPSTTGANAVASIISGIVRGCGSSSTSVSRADNATDSDFIAAGKTADGKTVYAFKDNSNALVQKAYSEYKDFYADVTGTTVIPFNDFLQQHALVAYKSANGGWLVYTRDQYAAQSGCAKPVVYLYPTHAENVTVKVGAQVTKSDPLYDPSTGWTALAQPNGQLTVGGKTYSSLFWEGQGTGLYPGVASGTVVKRADALATIKSQLKQQGLKQNEINDFVAYWQGKIPNQSYIRLTWFTTAQMNQLAPLNINPKPDTLIRVFLDMDGYTKPPKLPAQHLTAIPRKGFTVVEWGGLSQSALQ